MYPAWQVQGNGWWTRLITARVPAKASPTPLLLCAIVLRPTIPPDHNRKYCRPWDIFLPYNCAERQIPEIWLQATTVLFPVSSPSIHCWPLLTFAVFRYYNQPVLPALLTETVPTATSFKSNMLWKQSSEELAQSVSKAKTS